MEEDGFERRLVLATRLGAQLVDRAEGDETAVLDDPDPVAELLGDLQAVRRHEHRRAAGGEVAEHALEQTRAARVHAHGRLVHHQDPRAWISAPAITRRCFMPCE